MRARTANLLFPGRWPLLLQLAIGFALVVALALGGGGALLLQQMEGRQLADRSGGLILQANVAANLVVDLRRRDEPQGLERGLAQFHQQTGVRPVVVDVNGIVVADSFAASELLGQRLTHPEVAQALLGGQVSDTRWLGTDAWVMYAAVPLYQERQVIGAILVSADIGGIDRALRDLQWQLLLVALSAGAVAILFGIGLARYLTQPLARLNRAASAMAAGRLETQVVPLGSREVAELGHSFNRMSTELGRLDRQRRAFVADASHELRTPIASVRALAEGLLADPTGDRERTREFLGDIVQECDRAARLVERLLELARLDARHQARTKGAATGAPPEVIDLRETATALVHAHRPLAHERGVALDLVTPPTRVLVAADPHLVESILGNLVENALSYTLRGGKVLVTVKQEGEQAEVIVSDTGPGIAPEHLPHIFERFYRVDKARARATGGAGLGLAIAAEAAALLGGRVAVASEPGKGSTFTLILKSDGKRRGSVTLS